MRSWNVNCTRIGYMSGKSLHFLFCWYSYSYVCLCGVAGDGNNFRRQMKNVNAKQMWISISQISKMPLKVKHTARSIAAQSARQVDQTPTYVPLYALSVSIDWNEMIPKYNYLRIGIKCLHSIALIHCVCDSQLNWKRARTSYAIANVSVVASC